MFESLSNRLSSTIQKLRGRARLTEENIREAMRDVRIALLEADVALPVVSALIERIKQRAVGQDVLKSLSPGQAPNRPAARRQAPAVPGQAASRPGHPTGHGACLPRNEGRAGLAARPHARACGSPETENTTGGRSPHRSPR